jgi:RimJ/RimL family protein N-acetyltransferase
VIELASSLVSIETNRLELVPLVAEHADELFPLLSNATLYEFTHDKPPSSLIELRERYELLQSRRSPDGSEAWLNWIIRGLSSGEAIGYVQATVSLSEADIAWVVGKPWQGHGFATEAAQAMMSWLGLAGVSTFHAKINPIHAASERVAAKVGLSPTNEVTEGETVWMSFQIGR